MKAYHELRSYPPDFPLRIYRHEQKQFSFRAHWHSDMEAVLVMDGSVRFGINQEVTILTKGEVAVCCSGDIHWYESMDQATFYILVFQPSLLGGYAARPSDISYKSSFLTKDTIQESGINPGIRDRLKGLFDEVYAEMQLNDPYSPMIITGKTLELLATLQRHAPDTQLDGEQENRRTANLKTMQKIIEYLQSDYMQPLTLAETAGHFNLSTFHFCRLFKSLTGTNFKHYLNAIRADAAEEQIRSTNDPITTVALDCGFNNIRTFNRVFKSIKGYNPSSLRE
ncbi:AraC family transcriptional regulator [Paenibacillus sp. PK3_47]|uniref:AraC family transcriptional regulator n=1 Tax=Paenibacillus sp. PK3_47 TaxID=2072642 RepID=UPI00201E5FA0|nr:AraC family transcriptional regulator [Paenibacillus sp. PK3_47]